MASASRREPSGLAALATMTGFDPAERSLAAQRLLAGQNLPLAIAAGSAAALFGAGAWAIVAVWSAGLQADIVAIGVGWLVGMAVRVAGRGVTPVFAVLAGGLSLLGCALGSLLAAAAAAAVRGGVPVATALRQLDFASARILVMASLGPWALAFYACGAVEAYRLALRPIGRAEVQALLSGPSGPTPSSPGEAPPWRKGGRRL